MNVTQDLRLSGLSRGISYYLSKAQIRTIEDLLKHDISKLHHIPGIGKKSMIKILDFIKNYKKEKEDKSQKLLYIREIDNKIYEKLIQLENRVHDINTIILEQHRIIQALQLEKSPDGLLRQLNDKIPGIYSLIYDLYKKLG